MRCYVDCRPVLAPRPGRAHGAGRARHVFSRTETRSFGTSISVKMALSPARVEKRARVSSTNLPTEPCYHQTPNPARPDNARRRVRSPDTFGAVAHFRVQVFQAHRASPSEPLPNVTSQARPDSHGLSRRERAPTRRPATRTPTAPSLPEDGTPDVPCQLMHTSCASFRNVAPPRAAMPPRTVLTAGWGCLTTARVVDRGR